MTSPAAFVLAVIAVAGVACAYASYARTRWIAVVAGALCIAWALLAMAVRDLSLPVYVAVTPPDALAGWAARIHGGAAGIAAWGAVSAAAVALAAAARAEPDARRAPIAWAIGWFGVAAWFGADALVYGRLASSGALGVTAVIRSASVPFAVGCAIGACAASLRAGGAFVVAGGSVLGVAWLTSGVSLRFAPPEALALVRDRLPEVDEPSRVRFARPQGGCLVGSDGATTVGRPAAASLVACPAVPRGGFGDGDVPLLAYAADTSTAELTGWHTGGAGAVAVLTRVGDDPWPWSGLGRWQVAAERVEVWQDLASPRAKLLPGSVGLVGPADHPVLVTADGQVPAGSSSGDAAEAVARAVSGHSRVDVLVHPSLAPTVGALLTLCRDVTLRARGAQCVLAPDAERLVAALTTPAPEHAPPPEVEQDTLSGEEPFE